MSPFKGKSLSYKVKYEGDADEGEDNEGEDDECEDDEGEGEGKDDEKSFVKRNGSQQQGLSSSLSGLQ